MGVRHRFAVALLAAATAVTGAGCGVFGDDGPEELVAEFLAAFGSGDVELAAGLTDSPDSARTVLGQARTALAPESLTAEVLSVDVPAGASSATATYRVDWRLPQGRDWSYEARAQLYSAQEEWRLHWLPSLVHPDLAAQQTLGVRTETPEPAPVLDRDGAALLQPETVVAVALHPAEAGDVSAVAAALANALGPLEPAITKKSIVDGAATAAPERPYPVAVLRTEDYRRVKPAIYELPGVRFTEQERMLPADRDLGEQVLPAIRTIVEDRVAGGAGWRVVTVDATGAELAELRAEPARPADAVVSTLSRRVQGAAEDALGPVPVPAAIVALEPETGELLAVAQNPAADEQGPIALTGRYPPGSTFKMATAAAALGSGKAGPETEVDCPSTTVIGGRLIPNDDRFALGTVPVRTAFARSCNTTFARLSAELPATALTDAAASLGIGADFVLPGVTTITGAAPPAGTVVQQAENGFGQGTVLASPFGMAVAAATVSAGRTPVPTLIRGMPAEASGLGAPLRPEVLTALRSMMREVVTGGTAGALAQLPGVHGKTGTAQFGDGTGSHGWFVGYDDDLAFAVLLVGGGTSAPAVDAAHRFLTGLG
ncbi:penicillin-binding protein [Amycolatopsis antarctica]|uniref:Penicillin-binding protein n=1 Tax=Amycolatopsis antarctica TaxID=1854586 RepID=A0A263CW90_9PSEU|nr:penicillin-binding transpeptidase domain-containing protein [Amycolatopsis antarctica]OZM70228.1 penicillin-binding protein [Amycolatopsis antarctica]